jgi:predicted metal-binding membrane protein
MGRGGRLPDAWLVALGAACLVSWAVLALGADGLTAPALCSSGASGAPPSSAFDLALALNSSAGLAAGSALMVAAMMSPVLVDPVRHLRERSFARRRTRATLLFVAGYAGVWIMAGMALEIAAFAMRWAAPAPLGFAAAAAVFWQVSPAKQFCLNRCHRRPPLAAFGGAADRDALAFGISNGAACLGACWALMLLAFLVGHGDLLMMVAIALLVAAERLERPGPLGWRLRLPVRALRIASSQGRILASEVCTFASTATPPKWHQIVPENFGSVLRRAIDQQ